MIRIIYVLIPSSRGRPARGCQVGKSPDYIKQEDSRNFAQLSNLTISMAIPLLRSLCMNHRLQGRLQYSREKALMIDFLEYTNGFKPSFRAGSATNHIYYLLKAVSDLSTSRTIGRN